MWTLNNEMHSGANKKSKRGHVDTRVDSQWVGLGSKETEELGSSADLRTWTHAWKWP